MVLVWCPGWGSCRRCLGFGRALQGVPDGAGQGRAHGQCLCVLVGHREGVRPSSCPAVASLGSSAEGRLLLVVRILLDLVFWSVLSVSQVELLYSSARTCLRAVLTGIPHLCSSSSTWYCHSLQCFVVIEETNSIRALNFYRARYLELLRGREVCGSRGAGSPAWPFPGKCSLCCSSPGCAVVAERGLAAFSFTLPFPCGCLGSDSPALDLS